MIIKEAGRFSGHAGKHAALLQMDTPGHFPGNGGFFMRGAVKKLAAVLALACLLACAALGAQNVPGADCILPCACWTSSRPAYVDAQALMAQGELEQARQAFLALEEYQDSAQLAKKFGFI